MTQDIIRSDFNCSGSTRPSILFPDMLMMSFYDTKPSCLGLFFCKKTRAINQVYINIKGVIVL
jgi:hypothetical protein